MVRGLLFQHNFDFMVLQAMQWELISILQEKPLNIVPMFPWEALYNIIPSQSGLAFYKLFNVYIYNFAVKELSIYSLEVFLKEMVKMTRENLAGFFYYIVTIN